jgi:hypothetical protein
MVEPKTLSMEIFRRSMPKAQPPSIFIFSKPPTDDECRLKLTIGVAAKPTGGYIDAVNRLTKQEQLFLAVVLGLLLTGWAVKTYRTAHPPTATVQEARP